MFELSDLPTEVLEIIFGHLEASSIKKVSECCTQFRDIVQNTDKLTKRLSLNMRYPQDLKKFADVIFISERRYRKLTIVKSRDSSNEENTDCQINRMTNRLFSKLGETVQDLKIDWINAMRPREACLFDFVNQRRIAIRGNIGDAFDNVLAVQAMGSIRDTMYTDFLNMIRHFGHLTQLSLVSVHLERSLLSTEQPISLPHLNRLSLVYCDAHCFDILKPCTELKTLYVGDPWWNSRNPGVDNFENFLLSQICLKELRMKNIQYPRMFQSDRTNEIQFKLKTLELKDCYFANCDHADNFFRTQTDLKHLSIQIQNEKIRELDSMNWYNNILKTITAAHLETINIEKNNYELENCDFLPKARNPHVKRLNYKATSDDDSLLFKSLLQIYSDLKEIIFQTEESEDTDCGICFNEGTVLEKVEKMSVMNSSATSLVNILTPYLTDFQFVPGKTGEFIDDPFGLFFHRHRTIKHLTIGTLTERSYFFVSYNLCSLMVNFLNHLESVTIYSKFCEVNKSVKLLCSLPSLKTLTILSEDYQQFTAKTKVECARNDLKLINVDYS